MYAYTGPRSTALLLPVLLRLRRVPEGGVVLPSSRAGASLATVRMLLLRRLVLLLLLWVVVLPLLRLLRLCGGGRRARATARPRLPPRPCGLTRRRCLCGHWPRTAAAVRCSVGCTCSSCRHGRVATR